MLLISIKGFKEMEGFFDFHNDKREFHSSSRKFKRILFLSRQIFKSSNLSRIKCSLSVELELHTKSSLIHRKYCILYSKTFLVFISNMCFDFLFSLRDEIIELEKSVLKQSYCVTHRRAS